MGASLFKPALLLALPLTSFFMGTFCVSLFRFIMSFRTARTAMASLRSPAASTQRLSQVQRHFSASTSVKQEVQEAYILSAARTPTAKFNGSYTTVSAPQLGAVAIKSALEKSKVPVSKITDVYMGNVLQASVGQSPARQAAIFAGLPNTIEAITINKVCASGLKAVVFAAQNIQLGLAEAQIAGGMESLSLSLSLLSSLFSLLSSLFSLLSSL